MKLQFVFAVLLTAGQATELSYTANNSSSIQNTTDMILLPGGKTVIGTDDMVIISDSEGPSQKVWLASFFIDKYEVSNKKYLQFVRESNYVTEAEHLGSSFVLMAYDRKAPITRSKKKIVETPVWILANNTNWKHPEGPESSIKNRQNHPVVHVSWHDARAYCHWFGKRLPTEAEWEYASRGGLKNRLFPWGNNPLPKGKHNMNIWQGQFPKENTAEDGFTDTAPVDSYLPNKFGLYNTVGNVWEWVSDWWSRRNKQQSSSDQLINPKGPNNGIKKVQKGGSYLCHKSYCYRYRCAARNTAPPETSAINVGFRCAMDIRQ